MSEEKRSTGQHQSIVEYWDMMCLRTDLDSVRFVHRMWIL